MKPAEVAVVIPTHNRREALLRCLAHVQRLGGVSPCAIVVCDGCTDGSQEAIRKRFPDTVVVEGNGSLWWSGAINAGIEAARQYGATHVCLLNDDVEPAPDMLAALMRAAADHPDALIGPVIYHAGDRTRIWCAGGWTDWFGRGAYMSSELPAGASGCLPAQWLPGMGTLIPLSVIERIGMMDARAFPQYFGDTDFSLRAHKAGIPVLVCPDAQLYNDVASTGVLLPAGPISWRAARDVLTSLRSHANVRTRLRFWLRHCPPGLIPWQVARFYGPLLAVIAKKLTWCHLVGWATAARGQVPVIADTGVSDES